MLRVSAVLLLAVVACASARLVVPPSMIQGGWREAEPVSPGHVMTLTVALVERNQDMMEKIALDVSNPKSPRYAQYLSAKAIRELTEPTPAAFRTVEEWLEAQGAFSLERIGNVVRCQMAAANVSKALDTTVAHVENQATGQRAVRATHYTIPASIAPLVSAIFGLHGLPLPPRGQPGSPASNFNPVDVTPDVINQVYGVSGVSVSRGTKNRQAVAEFQGQLMQPKDLVTFFQRYVKNFQPGDDQVYKFVGTQKEVGYGIEAQLDIQYIAGVAPGIKTEFWEQLNQDFCADLKNWTTLLLADDDVPNVHSVSYGWQGNLTQIQCEDAEVKDVDADFQKLAAKGVTIIFASGDSGSGYTNAPTCGPNPGTKGVANQGETVATVRVPNVEVCCEYSAQFAGYTFIAPENCTLFRKITNRKSDPKAISGGASDSGVLWPSWPASSPWVTAVGATEFINNVVASGPERAVERFGSGGGFSTMFPQATWQKTAVEAYLNSGTPLPSHFARGGRATPDVSALGDGFQVINEGSPISVGGTSASAPLFAGLVSLLNEARMAKGKAPLGFLNQWVYQNADMFTPVHEGDDFVGRGGQPLPEGFMCNATSQWNPVDGLGTPIFSKMLTAALNA